MTTAATSFGLARMSRLIMVLSGGLLALPIVLLANVALGKQAFAAPALLVVAIYAWVWLRFRPTRFVVRPDVLEVVWPLKRRQIPRRDISGLRLLDGKGLRREIGWGLRIGAGGLWGGFGWLWTRKRGTVQMCQPGVLHMV